MNQTSQYVRSAHLRVRQFENPVDGCVTAINCAYAKHFTEAKERSPAYLPPCARGGIERCADMPLGKPPLQ